jgi:alkylation response protein AidB-like acyl-CoA dehydrogenase
MDLALSAQQADIQARVHRLAQAVIAPRAADVDRAGRFPRENFAALHRAGLLGLFIPARLNGPGADIVGYVLAGEEVGKACGSTALPYLMHEGNCLTVLVGGNEEQQRRYLGAVIGEGKLIGVAFSEPGSGSNFAVPQITSTRRDGEYVLNGRKFFATGAGHMDYLLVNTQAEGATAPTDTNLFLLEARDNPGVRVEATWDAMGMRGTASDDVVLTDCVVPVRDRLGEHGKALDILLQVAGVYYLGMAAAYLGIGQAALDFAATHLQTRKQFPDPKPLAHFQGLRFAFADAHVQLQGARWLLYHAAWMAMADPAGAVVAVHEAKLACTTAAIRATDEAMQLCGGRGFLKKNPVERYYRDARAGALMAANAEVCREFIAKPLLGMDPLAAE